MINKLLDLLRRFSASPLAPINFLTRLDNTLKEIIMNQAEMKAIVEASEASVEAAMVKLDKITTEVQALQTALANSNNTLDPSVEAAVVKLSNTTDALTAKVQAVDDLNADAVVDATVVDPVAAVEESVKAAEEAKAIELIPTDMTSVDGNSPS